MLYLLWCHRNTLKKLLFRIKSDNCFQCYKNLSYTSRSFRMESNFFKLFHSILDIHFLMKAKIDFLEVTNGDPLSNLVRSQLYNIRYSY